jgi:hypothetical protein
MARKNTDIFCGKDARFGVRSCLRLDIVWIIGPKNEEVGAKKTRFLVSTYFERTLKVPQQE